MHPLSLEARPAEREPDWRAWRRPESAADRELGPAAIAWLSSLPLAVRPYELARRFPRILNQITRTLHEPAQLESTMDSLLVDHRGNRQGFPAEVARDLMRLHLFFQERRCYAPARRRTDASLQRARTARYADHELVQSILAPALPHARRHRSPAPRRPGVWKRLVRSLLPQFR